jgi:hypothetical protein
MSSFPVINFSKENSMEQSMMPLASGEGGPVTATLVPQTQRLDFLPRHFGTAALAVEGAVFVTMERLCAAYHGGYWDFYDLSNGGALLVPSGAAQYYLECDGNGHACHLPPLATGVAVCAMAYNHLAFRRDGRVFSEMFYRLRDFLAQQPEAGELWALID